MKAQRAIEVTAILLGAVQCLSGCGALESGARDEALKTESSCIETVHECVGTEMAGHKYPATSEMHCCVNDVWEHPYSKDMSAASNVSAQCQISLDAPKFGAALAAQGGNFTSATLKATKEEEALHRMTAHCGGHTDPKDLGTCKSGGEQLDVRSYLADGEAVWSGVKQGNITAEGLNKLGIKGVSASAGGSGGTTVTLTLTNFHTCHNDAHTPCKDVLSPPAAMLEKQGWTHVSQD